MRAKTLKGYLNKEEASQYTGLSVRTLENYLHQIPHYRIGRRVLFKPSDLDSWLEKFRREPGNNVNEIVEDILLKLEKGGD